MNSNKVLIEVAVVLITIIAIVTIMTITIRRIDDNDIHENNINIIMAIAIATVKIVTVTIITMIRDVDDNILIIMQHYFCNCLLTSRRYLKWLVSPSNIGFVTRITISLKFTYSHWENWQMCTFSFTKSQNKSTLCQEEHLFILKNVFLSIYRNTINYYHESSPEYIPIVFQ